MHRRCSLSKISTPYAYANLRQASIEEGKSALFPLGDGEWLAQRLEMLGVSERDTLRVAADLILALVDESP